MFSNGGTIGKDIGGVPISRADESLSAIVVHLFVVL